MSRELWIFGYGSLIWRPGFPYVERHVARLPGFVRRFWQGSTDHRGVPGAPGRVVTLIAEPRGHCDGVVFRAAGTARERILEGLDFREQGGYAREWHEIALHATPGGTSIRALVYRATSSNTNFLGPASSAEIARQVAASAGPSGRNDTYVLELERALRAEGICDPHVTEVARQLHPADG